MRQVRKQIRSQATGRQDHESADLRFDREDLNSIGALVRSIDLLLSESS